MSTPLRSFVGGLGLALPVYLFLKLNGAVFGIAGFLHQAVRGDKEAAAAVTGLIFGGLVPVERTLPRNIVVDLPKIVLSGLLIGAGSRLSNGCTSGHMICGVSRFSPRSIVATATFVFTGVITTHLVHRDSLPVIGSPDYTLHPNGEALVGLQLIPLLVSGLLYYFAPSEKSSSSEKSTPSETSALYPDPIDSEANSIQSVIPSPLRLLAALSTAFSFALALRLSNLTDPARVAAFLLLPLHAAFDSSLLFLAAGALPLAAVLYPGPSRPWLGGSWTVPSSGIIDTRLVFGAAMFGVGWGLAGICPGPGLVNFGRAVASGENEVSATAWLMSVVIGGLVA